jgi:two-component system sensor histidine kinase PilS (NtrC family)
VTSMPQHIRLRPWLDGFMDEFTHSGLCHRGQISCVVEPEDLEITMDPSLLHQVVWNLCQNAASHGNAGSEPVYIRLQGGHSGASRTPYLDIIDNGPGVDPEVADEIFEPFFTTGGSGTGLGLYIAREICESNQAQLRLHPVPGGGSRFRITFTDTERLPASVFA